MARDAGSTSHIPFGRPAKRLSAMSWQSGAFEASTNDMVKRDNCKVVILACFSGWGVSPYTWLLPAKSVAGQEFEILGSLISCCDDLDGVLLGR
jgi:hypothetical protein